MAGYVDNLAFLGYTMGGGQGLLGLQGPISSIFPAGVTKPDIWLRAQDLASLGFTEGQDVGNPSPDNDWIDRGKLGLNIRFREIGGFEPHFDAVVAGFGNGTAPGVLNIGQSTPFEVLFPYTPITNFNWPASAVGTDPCSIGWIGRFTDHTSVIGDENTSVSAADQIGMYDSGADTIIFVNNGSNTLTVGTITGVQPPFNTICFVAKRGQTDWHSWHNGAKVGNGIGTLGSVMNFTRILRARATSGGQPLGTWTCVDFFVWDSYALTDADVVTMSTFFNGKYGVF